MWICRRIQLPNGKRVFRFWFRFELPDAYQSVLENGELSPKYKTLLDFDLVWRDDTHTRLWHALPTVRVDHQAVCPSRRDVKTHSATRLRQGAYNREANTWRSHALRATHRDRGRTLSLDDRC